MSYKCEQCEAESTFGDALSNIVKIVLVVGVGYMAFTFRDQLKEVVGAAIEKGKKQLSGPKKSRRK